MGRLSKHAARWRFNTSLLKKCIHQFIVGFREFVSFNVDSVEDPRVLWDAIKDFIRSNETRSLLEAEFTRLDSILQHNFALQRTLVKKEINNIMKQQSEFQIHRTQQRYYSHGARPSHLLAMRISRSKNRYPSY